MKQNRHPFNFFAQVPALYFLCVSNVDNRFDFFSLYSILSVFCNSVRYFHQIVFIELTIVIVLWYLGIIFISK